MSSWFAASLEYKAYLVEILIRLEEISLFMHFWDN